MRHFYPHPLTGNDWHLFMALVMLHKLLPMFVNRKTIVLGTGMAFLLAQTLVHLFHVLLLLFCAGNAYFISFCSVFSSSSTTSSFPARISSATQVRIWFASSSRLNAFIAAVTAADCTRISGQYTSFSTIPRMPRICPSIRFSLWTRLLYSSSLRCFVLCAQQQHGSFSSFSCIMYPPITCKVPRRGIFTVYPARVPCQVDNIIFLYYFMREFFTIAIFKIKADIRMNKTTLNSQKEKHSIANFYPRSPCGERPYTLSLPRRRKSDFYPRSPCGERLHIGRGCVMIHRISIHALLAESDTTKVAGLLALIYISIHALLAESDGSSAVFSGCCTGISIHALLAESDADRIGYAVRLLYFYPRSPCGERRYLIAVSHPHGAISIHALLAESDLPLLTVILRLVNFYPRSPCGERPPLADGAQARATFLSTLSLRRATRHWQTGQSRTRHFYPRSPCGERPPGP